MAAQTQLIPRSAHPLFTLNFLVCADVDHRKKPMKLKFALVGLAALGSLAAAGAASAMPLAPLSPVSNVESAAVVCGVNGCIRTRPVYRYGYGVRRYGYVGRGYRRAYRRW